MCVVVLLFTCMLSMLAADPVRIGVIGAIEICDNPLDIDSYNDHELIYPGFYVEVLFGRLGVGMTALARFHSERSSFPEVDRAWDFTWIGSLDLRYHFSVDEGLFDPFAELGIGCAGRVDLPVYDRDGELYDEGELESISLFMSIGGGIIFNLDAFHVGVKVQYRFINDGIPTLPYPAAPVTGFQSAVFVGFNL